jgi:predicted CoA-binding protein
MVKEKEGNTQTTLVLGASTKPGRASHTALRRLIAQGRHVVAIGAQAGVVDGVAIHTSPPPLKEVDTVTLYLGAERQKLYYDYILELKPRRLIFNPGAENEEFSALAQRAGIETLPACTLVLLSLGTY